MKSQLGNYVESPHELKGTTIAPNISKILLMAKKVPMRIPFYCMWALSTYEFIDANIEKHVAKSIQ